MLTVADLKAALAEFPDHWPVTVEVPPGLDSDELNPLVVDDAKPRKVRTENTVMLDTSLY